MAEHDAYHNGYYLEVSSVNVPSSPNRIVIEPDGEVIGYRWEVRHESEWLDSSPFDYGIVSSLNQAKNNAQIAAV
jgi:hypothetical protein